MKYILQVIGTMLYGLVSSYLIWLLFYFITPYIMGASWFVIILYVLFAGGLVTAITTSIATLLSVPNFFFMGNNKLAKIIYCIFCLFWGYSSITLPYQLDVSFGVKEWILAISISLTAFSIYISLICAAWRSED